MHGFRFDLVSTLTRRHTIWFRFGAVYSVDECPHWSGTLCSAIMRYDFQGYILFPSVKPVSHKTANRLSLFQPIFFSPDKKERTRKNKKKGSQITVSQCSDLVVVRLVAGITPREWIRSSARVAFFCGSACVRKDNLSILINLPRLVQGRL